LFSSSREWSPCSAERNHPDGRWSQAFLDESPPIRCSDPGGHAFVQNLRRGRYELATDVPAKLRLNTAFTALALAM